jgi:acyl-coenzyme A thioesterase PaaI-like protein
VAISAKSMRRGMNFWPPLLFSGIRITHIADDWRAVDVELRETLLNRNYVGAHFGGSIFAMTDPFWMMMVMNCLDRSYTVWDREASIRFLKPGKGTLKAAFRLDDAVLDEIRASTIDEGSKYLKSLSVNITNQAGETIATVDKVLHVRRRADTRSRIGG